MQADGGGRHPCRRCWGGMRCRPGLGAGAGDVLKEEALRGPGSACCTPTHGRSCRRPGERAAGGRRASATPVGCGTFPRPRQQAPAPPWPQQQAAALMCFASGCRCALQVPDSLVQRRAEVVARLKTLEAQVGPGGVCGGVAGAGKKLGGWGACRNCCSSVSAVGSMGLLLTAAAGWTACTERDGEGASRGVTAGAAGATGPPEQQLAHCHAHKQLGAARSLVQLGRCRRLGGNVVASSIAPAAETALPWVW